MDKLRRRISRILGISAALTISAGLVAAAVPAQAAGINPLDKLKLSALQGVTWVSDLSPRGTISFGDGTVTGKDSCNIFHGSYEYKNGTLTFGPMMQTMMYCDEDQHVQRAFSRMFAASNKFTVRYHFNDTKRLAIAPIDVKGMPMTFTASPKRLAQ